MLVNCWTWNFGWGSAERPEEDKSQGQKGERRRWMRRRKKKGTCVCVVVCVCPGRLKCTKRHEQSRQASDFSCSLQSTCLLQHQVTSPWPHWELYNWLRYCNVLTQLISGISFLTKERDEPCLSETPPKKKCEFQLRRSFIIPVSFQTHLHLGSSLTHARQRNPIWKRRRVWLRRCTCAVDSTRVFFLFCFFQTIWWGV